MIVTHKIKMDLMQRGMTPRVDVVQGDICSRQLELSLFSGGKEWPVPEGVNVAVRYCKSDKTKGYYDSMPDGTRAWEADGNRLTVMLVPQMLSAEGPVLAQVEMILGTKLLATFTVQVYVNANPAEGFIKSENYVNWLQWMEEELDRHMQNLSDAFAELEIPVDATLSVAGAAADAGAVGTAISNLETDLSNQNTNLRQAEIRLDLLDKDMTTQSETIGGHASQLSNHSSQINDLQDQQSTHSSQIKTLQTQQSSNSTAITNLQTKANTQGNQITTNQNQISNHSSRLSSAESQIASHTTKLTSLENSLKDKATLLQVYPVGSIYMSVTNKSPATLFGGTWTQLKDRFLLGAGNSYNNGTTGGAATHKLSVSEMPSHTHDLVMASSNNGTTGYSTNQLAIGIPGTTYTNDNPVNATGGNAAHNNMPPYLAVYMWKRTA